MRRVSIMLAAALLSTATAAFAERVSSADRRAGELDRALAGRVAGEPRSCLSLLQTRDSTSYAGTILYRADRNTVYRNDLGGCPELRWDTYPVFNIHGSQLCQGEIVQIVQRGGGFPAGSCVVGPFVPYTRIPGTR